MSLELSGKPATGVSLAHTEDFSIGSACVSPGNCEVIFEGSTYSLQPRIMQVLVMLHSLDGKVATKEDLIQNCWAGAAVSDDVITRSISQLRSLAKKLDSRVFSIKTVSRVGYALILNEGPKQKIGIATAKENLSIETPDDARPRKRLMALLLLASLVIAIPISIWAWQSNYASGDWVLTDVHYLSSDPTHQIHPAVSPDDKSVIYSSYEGSENRDIWMRQSAGGKPFRLTDHPDFDHLVSYAPSGDKIAFVRSKFGASDSPCRILTKHLDTGKETIVARCKKSSFGLSTPAWGFDSKSLIISQALSDEPDSALQLVELNLETGKQTVLTKPSSKIRGDLDPVLSPDGSQILFRRAITLATGNRFLLNIADRSVIQLTHDNKFRSNIWTPDGRQILIISSDAEDGISVFSKNGELIERRASGLLEGTGRMKRGNILIAAETIKFNSVLTDKSSGQERELAAVDGRHDYPEISSNGDIAFLAYERERVGLWLATKNGKPRRLTDLPRVNALSWSADGRKIAFAPSGGGYVGIYDLDSEKKTRLPFKGKQIGSIVWMPGGKHLVFAGFDNDLWRLWRINVSGSEKATHWSKPGWWSVRSNNNAIFASRSDKPGIWQMSNGGEPQRQVETTYNTGQEIGRTITARNGFAVTDQQLYFYRAKETGNTGGAIMVQPLDAGSSPVVAVKLSQQFASFAAADDDHIVYVRQRNSVKIITMKLNQL